MLPAVYPELLHNMHNCQQWSADNSSQYWKVSQTVLLSEDVIRCDDATSCAAPDDQRGCFCYDIENSQNATASNLQADNLILFIQRVIFKQLFD
jgi:hypothetical protein